MHKPDAMVGDDQKKRGIEIWFTSGLDVVLKKSWSIDDFWSRVEGLISQGRDFMVVEGGMICLSQIVFAQECDIEDDEEA